MAKPDLDDGAIHFAHELYAALCVAGFGGDELIVLREALTQLFAPGRTKKSTALLRPSELGRIHRRLGESRASRAVRSLVRSRVLVPVEALRCRYRFNKDYERWRFVGSDGRETARLTREDVRYCKEAPHRAFLWAQQEDIPEPEPEPEPIAAPVSAPPPEPPQKPAREAMKGRHEAQVGILAAAESETETDLEPFECPPPKASERLAVATTAPTPERLRLGALADRITKEVFGLTEEDGQPDAQTSLLIRNWLPDGVDERLVWEAAQKARGKSSPVPYFLAIARGGFRLSVPGPETGAVTNPEPSVHRASPEARERLRKLRRRENDG